MEIGEKYEFCSVQCGRIYKARSTARADQIRRVLLKFENLMGSSETWSHTLITFHQWLKQEANAWK